MLSHDNCGRSECCAGGEHQSNPEVQVGIVAGLRVRRLVDRIAVSAVSGAEKADAAPSIFIAVTLLSYPSAEHFRTEAGSSGYEMNAPSGAPSESTFSIQRTS